MPPAAQRPLNLARINSIHFIAGTGGVRFDLWIDDLALICRGICPPRP
jgi:hypothetical protein